MYIYILCPLIYINLHCKQLPLLGKTPLTKKAHEKSLSSRAKFNGRLEPPCWLEKGGAEQTLGQDGFYRRGRLRS
jgi:hypothetical protein